MARYKKHKKHSIEERNQLVLLYLDRHMSSFQIIRDNNIFPDILEINLLFRCQVVNLSIQSCFYRYTHLDEVYMSLNLLNPLY